MIRSVRVVEHTDQPAVHCIHGKCWWSGPGIDPEAEALAHAEAHPGHTAVVEWCRWVEYIGRDSAGCVVLSELPAGASGRSRTVARPQPEERSE